MGFEGYGLGWAFVHKEVVAKSGNFFPAEKCGFPEKGTFHGLDVVGTFCPVEACRFP